jgi:hypothetical protein
MPGSYVAHDWQDGVVALQNECVDRKVDAATLELLMWLSRGSRTYADAMEVWGSHCPRHTVWEDALAGGLVRVVRGRGPDVGSEVALTPLGQDLVASPT